MIKRIISILLVLVIAITVSGFNSFVYADAEAATVTFDLDNVINFDNVPATAYQSKDNYDEYYNINDGYLKNSIYFNGFDDDNQYQEYELQGLINSINNTDNTPIGYLNFTDLYFKPIEYNNTVIPFDNCHYSIDIVSSSNGSQLRLSLVYSPTGDSFAICGGICSEHDFIHTYVIYNIYTVSDDSQYYNYYDYVSEYQFNNAYDSYSSHFDDSYLYYSTWNQSYSGSGVILTDIPLLYQFRNDSEIVTDDYLDQEGFADVQYILFDYFNDTDDTGFVVDRRVSTLVSPTPTENLGVVNGSFGNLISGIDRSNMTLFTAFELNDYTKSLNTSIKLKQNYQVTFECTIGGYGFNFSSDFLTSQGYYDSYSINGKNINIVNLNEVFEQIYVTPDYYDGGSSGFGSLFKLFNGITYDMKIVNANNYLNTILNNGIKATYTETRVPYYPSSNTIFSDVSDFFSYFNLANYYNYKKQMKLAPTYEIDSISNTYSTVDIARVVITQYLENSLTGDTSNTYVFTYDMLTGDYSSVGGFEDDSTDDFDDYHHKDDGTGDSDIIYNPVGDNTAYGGNATAYGGNAYATIGDINVNANQERVIDIPYNEYIDSTPRLKTMMQDLSMALGEDKEQSVVTLIKSEYDYLPSKATNYLTYAVGVLCLVGIWKFVRRG